MNVCFNGKFYLADAPLLTAQNRSFKWGDGVFETIKVCNGNVLLNELHFERLFLSLRLLQIELPSHFSQSSLTAEILELCGLNNSSACARVRLAVYRNEDNTAGYLIEAIPLTEEINNWSAVGETIALYPYARKSMDAFANLKSANFLPYVLARKFASENGYDDAIVLNANNYLCDSSRANIFLIKNAEVFTPALHQGCVNGVMRRVVIEEVKRLGYPLYQKEITAEDLASADEAFLTNAIQIIRWVKSYNDSRYDFVQTRRIFDGVTATIF
jgi:branched-chain amino acid aminotransferase